MVAKRKNKTGFAAKAAGIGVASCLLVGCVGIGFASAGNTPADSSTFGVGSATSSTEYVSGEALEASDTGANEGSVLEARASRDISAGVNEINARHEAERIAAEEAARAEEEARIAAARENELKQAQNHALPDLPEVDWSVGKDAFISEWGARIDAYLSGSPLFGYGATFAAAAWDNGIDPRWSPAISNTESSKGAVCFRPYNAWGWMGTTAWSSWEESIYAHAAGLASGYGYTISPENAYKYCPPTWQDWYNKTLAQMLLI